jgi:hypothetical protein
MVRVTGNLDDGKQVSKSYSRDLVACFGEEVSNTKDQPLDYKRASQSSVEVKDAYFARVRAVVARRRADGSLKTEWPRPHQFISMDEQPFGNVDHKSTTIGEKQRFAQARLGVLPRNFRSRAGDRSSAHYSV